MTDAEFRVLYVVPGSTFGGAHNQIVAMAGALRDSGFESHVILPTEEGNAYDRIESAGVSVERMPLRRPRAGSVAINLVYLAGLPLQIWRLSRRIRVHNYDIVQSHGILQFDVAIAARLARAQLVWQLLDTRVPSRISKLMRLPFDRLASGVLCTGRGTLTHHFGNLELATPIHYYFPPVEEQKLEPIPVKRRSEVRASMGAHDDDILVGVLANFNPQKGLARVIKLAALDSNREFRFAVRGNVSPAHPSLLKDLQVSASEECISAQMFKELGDTTVGEFLRSIDLLLITSSPNSEGFPTVASEAMFCGLPVVSTPVGSIRDVIRAGYNGEVSSDFSGDSLWRAIQRARRLLGQTSTSQHVVQTYKAELAPERTLESYLSAYRQALDLRSEKGEVAVERSAKERLSAGARTYLPKRIAMHLRGLKNTRSLFGIHAPAQLLVELVPKDRLAIDVGANAGLYSHFISRRASRVHAFEPQPATFARLRASVSKQVTCHEIALSDVGGQAVLGTDFDGSGEATLVPKGHDRQFKVETRTLDSYQFRNVGFIKIDVEGYEEEVVTGAWQTICSEMPVLFVEIEERHNPGGVRRLVERLGNLGYSTQFLRGGHLFSISEFNTERDQIALSPDSPFYANNFVFHPPSIRQQ